MSIQSKLDDLISWYDKFKPDAGKRIPVAATPKDVGKFASAGRDSRWYYRNREIVPTQPDKAR